MLIAEKRNVYEQIVAELKILIETGAMRYGEKLPSVRTYAVERKVNPNTVAKAYQELEAENLIYTDGTLGKFVSNNRLYLAKKRQEYLEEQMASFKEELKKCGVDEEEFLCLAKK